MPPDLAHSDIANSVQKQIFPQEPIVRFVMLAERNPGLHNHHPLAAGTSTIMQVQAHATQVRRAN
jgi:hypothetical protein